MEEKLSYTEISARLQFSENHAKYLVSQLSEEKKKSEEMSVEIKELKSELQHLTDLLKLAGKKLYGSSTEKICEDHDQLSLFKNSDNEAIIVPKSSKTEVRSYYRAPKRSYDEIYGNLPADIIEYDVPENERICNKCKSKMVFIGYESYREIEYKRAEVKIKEHRRRKYVCQNCDKTGTESSFKAADAPLPLIDHSLVSPSLLSYMINEKFCKAVPLYRQEQEWKRMGINISRQTMSNWIIAAADMLRPLYNIMHKHLISETILHADETPLQVNHAEGKSKPIKGYMWVYRTGRYSDKPIILYEYRNGRSGSYPKEFMNGFLGYLRCDGLRQYDDIVSAVRVGCWAHLRRYFLNAVNVQHDKRDHTTVAGQGFMKINEIFHIEGRSPEKTYERSGYSLEKIALIRKEKSSELVEDFFKWCEKQQGVTVPGSLTGKALSYALGQKRSLMRFLDDPRLELTNNAAERAIKPVVIGRKNWLFANTEKGAVAAAIIYSVIETVKAASIKPFDYLNWFFNSLRKCDFKSFDDFLPWNDFIPDSLFLGSI